MRKGRTAQQVAALSICLLGVVTIVAGLRFPQPEDRRATRAGSTAVQSAPLSTTRPPSTTRPATPPAADRSRRTPTSSAELPPGGPVPAIGAGTWRVIPGASGVTGAGTVHTYAVEVENGVVPPGGDAAFAAAVQATLADPRSWIGGGDVAVRRIDSGKPDLHIRMASQKTARARCGFEIPVDVSCRDGGNVYLNAARWIRGAVAFGGDLAGYRRYMINHEVGHFFGQRHKPCKVHGGPAPVMMQQTFSTSNNEIAAITAGVPQGVTIPRNGKVCAPNPWPFP
ncbi:MAG TPA: DUF3152 domain-containing protein [Pilimelia sp.]|nr:DUF3152 domain-containing protein [Pilimelia sp.]